MTDDRYERGLQTLESIDAGVGRAAIDALRAGPRRLIHASVYRGFRKALNAIGAAKKVFAERGLLPVN